MYNTWRVIWLVLSWLSVIVWSIIIFRVHFCIRFDNNAMMGFMVQTIGSIQKNEQLFFTYF